MPSLVPQFPDRLSEQEFRPVAYRWMYLTRRLEDRIIQLFRKGLVKGTCTISIGNEATAVAMALPLRRGKDVVTLLHRDLPAHLILGANPYDLLCQYLANAGSLTHGKEGNVHHGCVDERRFPMISHLADMLSLCVGGVWAARQKGEDAMGVAVIGDGGTSAGDFHESVNLASVRGVPVLFLIENNHYAYSTPTRLQYHCEKLSDRAAGYGIKGKTIDGTDSWAAYNAVCDALDEMSKTRLPYILESMTLRLAGHAAYDKAEYVTAEEKNEWLKREPLVLARNALLSAAGWVESKIGTMEAEVDAFVEETVNRAVAVKHPSPPATPITVFASSSVEQVPPFTAKNVHNLNAVTLALDYILKHNPTAFVAGMDVGPYGSAFKTCKGLFDSYGPDRVMDMPICEAAITGFALGASQIGSFPIVEYQFADFSTEATTQLGLNAGTWYFRTERPAQMLFRLPCGGGITLGAFHSGEFEGLWSRFVGLKLLYPTTPQEMFEALVAGFYDPNPVVVLEHKLLYSHGKGDINFDGNLKSIWRPRRYIEGRDVTIITLGAMVEVCLEAVSQSGVSADVWNPFALSPLDLGPVIESVKKTGRLLVVQENNEIAGLGDRFVSICVRAVFGGLKAAPVIVSAPASPVPFAPELEIVHRPGVANVRQALTTLMGDVR